MHSFQRDCSRESTEEDGADGDQLDLVLADIFDHSDFGEELKGICKDHSICMTF